MSVAVVKSKKRLKPPWENIKKPFAERLQGAIDYLDFKVRNCNAVLAYQTIEKIVAEQRKIKLFQKYFPEEWKRSRKSLFKAGYYENYSEKINEFFELVNQKLFPLLAGWNENPETDFDNFNVFSLNVDFCCEDIEYEFLRVSYVVALLFFSRDEEIWEFFDQNYQVKKEDFPPIFDYSHENLWNLEKIGREELYLNIFEVIDHSTGNPWLDTTNCHYNECYSWDEETIQFLTKSYQEAQELLEKTCLLDDLIEANPKNVLLEMISLWNKGKIP